MHTAGILQSQDNQQLQLWQLTWDRINTFLPNLHRDVFKPHELGTSDVRQISLIFFT